jgi:rRNA maturation protein Nop10
MQAMSQMWPMMTMAMQKESKFKLPMTLPPGDVIAKHMGIEVSYSWFDQNGLWVHGKGPMGSSSVSGTVAFAAIGAAVALPAMGQAREAAKRAMSTSNLRQICIGLIAYSADNNGNFPTDLNVLVEKKIITKETLTSPLKPANFDGPSYIYIPGLKADSKPGTVMIYENPAYQCEGTNIGHIDASVTWVKPEVLVDELKKTYEILGKPMPKVEFKGEKSKSWFNWSPTSRQSEIDKERKIPFKCTNKDCGEVVFYTTRELTKTLKPGENPMMGPVVLDCPKCKKHTLTQAVECPKCGEIFIMMMDPQNGVFDDKCPKCGVSYAKAWQEKYQKEHPKK